MEKKGLIVALDLPAKAAKLLVDRLGAAVDFYKVAPSLYFEDAKIVRWLRNRGKKVFLDFKWYDIPSQVARSVAAAAEMGVSSCTIHASAGSAVMKAVLAVKKRPKVWGVTVLTSLGEKDIREAGVHSSPQAQVLRLARLAQKEGLDGLVCSPLETAFLRARKISLPLIVPGIQWGGAAGRDQTRVASPQKAWGDGADHIVVGRAILESRDPAVTAKEILESRRRTHADR